MNIDPKEKIANIGMLDVRKLLRTYRDLTFSAEAVQQTLKIPRRRATLLLSALKRRGLLEQPERGWYKNTVAGNALSLASATKPMKRATAERLVAELLQRSDAVNDDPSLLS